MSSDDGLGAAQRVRAGLEALFAEGLSVKQVAARLGLTKTRVRRLHAWRGLDAADFVVAAPMIECEVRALRAAREAATLCAILTNTNPGDTKP